MRIDHVLQARSMAKRGKCAGGGMPITAECLKFLPLNAVYAVFCIFRSRYEHTEPISVHDLPKWREILLASLRKGKLLKELSDWRSVCNINMMLKWYLPVLVLMVSEMPEPMAWKKLDYYGSNKIPADVPIAITQILCNKSHEWVTDVKLFVANGDKVSI